MQMKLKLATTLILLCFGVSCLAQVQNRITGRVTSATDGEPLVGVGVVQVNTKTGTTTDANGQFAIRIEIPCELQFSYIGFKPRIIKITSAKSLDIQLAEDSKNLNEVVVTALGMSREAKALGYAITEVQGDEIAKTRPTNAMGALSGKIPGVDISSTIAGPSGSTRVVIRGNGELNGNNQPLYVVDGVPMDNSQLGGAGMWGGYDMGDGVSAINPDDIDNISVLKGASAAALYGSRASNGVVLITTKSAKKKGLGISFSSSVDFVNQLSEFDDYQRVYGYGRNGELPITKDVGRGVSQSAWGAKIDGKLQGYIFDGSTKPYSNVKNNISSFFRTGSTLTNSLSLTAAGEKANLLFSVSDMRNWDIVPSSDMSRTSFMIKGSAKLLDKLDIEGRANYIHESVDNRPALSDSPNNIGLSLIGLAPNFDQHWLANYEDEYGKYRDWNGGNIYRINPYWSINNMSNNSKKDRVMGYMLLRYHIIDGLTLQGRAGTDFYKFRMTEFQGINTPTAPQGAMAETSTDVQETNLEAILRYDTKLNDVIDLGAFVGGNLMFFNSETFNNSGNDQIIPGMESIGNYVTHSLNYYKGRKQVRSVYGAINFAYKDFLYIDATIRNDWSSTLAKGRNSYLYPSISGSFIFTNLIPKNNILSFGKLRASWAEVGGDTDPYRLSLNYGVKPYTFNGKPLGEISSTGVPNHDLKPTRTYSYELGTQLKFFNNRVNLDFTYYHQSTQDQIMDLPISTTTGFTQATVNSGEIINQGIELGLNGTIIETPDLKWDAFINFAKNSNKVKSLHPELTAYPLAEARWAGAMIEAIEGKAYGVIVGKKMARTEDGQVIFDRSGYPVVGDKLEVLGNGVYDWTSGIGTSFTWKGLSLSVLFDVKWGADVYSMSAMMSHLNGTSEETLEGRDSWYYSEELRKQANLTINDWTPTGGFIGKGVVNVGTPENPVYEPNKTPVDPQKYWAYFESANTPEPFIYDASFVKLRELSLSYQLPDSWLLGTPLKSVVFSLYGRNLWTIYSDIPNVDPESNYSNSNGQGFEYGSLPSRRNFGFSVKLTL